MTTKQAVVQFIYPASAASDFNLDYYLNTHVSLLEKRWYSQGLRQWSIAVGEKGESYHVQATLIWESLEAFQNAQFVEEVAGDIPNFTSATPTRVVGTIVSHGSAPA